MLLLINARKQGRSAATAVCRGTNRDVGVRRSSGRKPFVPDRLWRQLDRSAGALNPFLLAVAVGLLILNLTCFITIKVIGLPQPQMPVCTTAEGLPAGSLPGETGRY